MLELTAEGMRDVTRELLKNDPMLTARQAWQQLGAKGRPPIKESSFASTVMPQVRRELGIKPP